MPTNRRGSSTGFSKAATVLGGGAGFEKTGGASAPLSPATSSSIDFMIASASSVRQIDSSQRGDSGNALRRYHTTSPPSPASTNMARQLVRGMLSVLASALKGKLVIPRTSWRAMFVLAGL